MSLSENEISTKYIMTDSETLFKILQALNFKGGSSSIPSLKIAVMLDDAVIKTALVAGQILKFIEEDGENYVLTDVGEQVLDVSKREQQDFIAKYVLAIEGYRDIIFRMKMTPNNEMSMKDISKAFYILEKDMREELRKQIIESFVNFSIFANIVENNNNTSNPGVKLTSNGEQKLDEAINKKKGKAPAKPSGAIASDLACPECGKSIMPDFIVCPYCGSELKRSCQTCGKELQPGWKMCPFCGNPA